MLGGTVEILSLSLCRVFGRLRPSCRPLIAALDDVICRFAPLEFEPEPVRTVRGTALALAQYWLVKLPPGPARDKAIDALLDAAELAVEAAYAAA